MEKIWKIKSLQPTNIIQSLLLNRGLTTQSAQREFLSPAQPQTITLQSLNLKPQAVTKAIKRITQAIKNQELIYIYGDYDADGISATAILWETLHDLGARVLPYIPSRNDPVRGLSPKGIEAIIDQNPKLIITVDNGISAFDGCDYAKNKGIDLIITDHHQPKHQDGRQKLPSAYSIIHTTQLAGAGVAWFFSREIVRHLRGERNSHLGGELLDLAAIGTIADMVPLLGANRSLASFGLKQLQTTSRPGLIALAQSAGIDLTQLTDHQISFVLGPRLNAMGRLEHALDSLRLLCTKNQPKATTLANKLNRINQLRQDKTLASFDHAKAIARRQKKSPLIFISDESYHEGLVGLVAGRLVEEFYRPAVVVAVGKNHAKASIRSIKGFNAIKNLRQIEPLFLEHGGHELAAGFTAQVSQLAAIKKQLLQLAKKQLTGKDLRPTLEIDCQIDLSEVSWPLYRQLEKFAPFGFANPKPVFATRKLKVLSAYPVGQQKKHLKLKLQELQGPTLKAILAIAFGFGHLAEKLSSGQTIDIAYTLEANLWNGQNSLELKIKDISLITSP